jgi:uncharacterized protein
MNLIGIILLYFCTGCSLLSQSKNKMDYSGPIIDMHVHISFDTQEALSMNRQFPPNPKNIVKSNNRSNITYSSAIVIAQKGNIESTKKLNDNLLSFVEKNPSFFAIGSVHPDDGTLAVKELQRISRLGIKAIKLHPSTQRFDVASKSVSIIVKEVAKLGMIILFDSYSPFDSEQMGKYVMLAIENPKAKFVLAHMGGPKFREFLIFSTLKEYPWYPNNLWFDISWTSDIFSQSPVEDEFVWTLRQIGMDKILFGSDFPIVDQAQAILSVRNLNLTLDEQRLVFYDNSVKLFDLKK